MVKTRKLKVYTCANIKSQIKNICLVECNKIRKIKRKTEWNQKKYIQVDHKL